jgi:hypothetical protein
MYVRVEFAYAKKIAIARNRAFQRFLERKRIVFDVFHDAKHWTSLSIFGNTPVHLGRCALKLDALLNKCEVHEVLDVRSSHLSLDLI